MYNDGKGSASFKALHCHVVRLYSVIKKGVHLDSFVFIGNSQ